MNNKSLTPAAALLSAALLASCAPQKATEHTLKAAVGNRFTIGAAASGEQIAGRDSLGLEILKRHFNSVVSENRMKCETIHPFEDTYYFDGADSLMAFAEANNFEVIGHCLVWHSQMAPWFCVDSLGNLVSPDILRQRIKNHIYTVMGRYKGRIHGWDVCNEMVVEDGSFRQSPLFKILGPEVIYYSLQCAHEADPDAELYLNDYGMNVPGRRDAYLAIIDTIRARGLRLDAIGMQGHMGIDYPQIDDFEYALNAFAAKGLPVMITEWELSALPTIHESANISEIAAGTDPYWPNPLPDSVATFWNNRIGSFWNLFIRNADKIKRVNAWGVMDNNSWKNDFPIPGRHDYPLLFDRQGNPKPFIKEFIDKELANK